MSSPTTRPLAARTSSSPFEPLKTKEDVDRVVDRINTLLPRLEKEGIRLHYHNHAHEFQPNEDGIIPEEELIARTKVLLEVDTYWVYAAEKDPVAFLREHKDRIQVIHLKDGKGGDSCASLGQGIAPVADVRKAAIELGFDMVVESEGPGPHRAGRGTALHGLPEGRGPEGRKVKAMERAAAAAAALFFSLL